MRLVILFAALLFMSNLSAQDQTLQKDHSRIIEIGQNAAASLLNSLKEELTSAMQEGGPVSAIYICSQKALDLTKVIAEKDTNVIEIKRAALKYRNIYNKPDEHETAAIKIFSGAGEVIPTYFVQESKEHKNAFNYYQPIKTAAMCLVCHGEKEKMGKEILTNIQKLYPDDKATGYKTGELRGVIKVIVKDN